MDRKSSRLLSNGYYKDHEDFDPTISYQENLVKIFKTRRHRPSSASTELRQSEVDSDDIHRVSTSPKDMPLTVVNGVGLKMRTKTACCVCLLTILLFPCVWFLLPSSDSYISGMNVPKTQTQENPKIAQELSAIHLKSSPAPCPDPHTAPVHNQLTPELLRAMEKFLSHHIKEFIARPMADQMADFALETQGASVIRARCSGTYNEDQSFVSVFGFTMYRSARGPCTVIKGDPVLSGRCWPFPGSRGTLAISLAHPITITHVTLDHLSRYNHPTGSIDSAPKDFGIYGMKNSSEEGTLLGAFTYDRHGEQTQTFKLPNPSEEVYRAVRLQVFSNWGNDKYTCLYRFRVHGKIANL